MPILMVYSYMHLLRHSMTGSQQKEKKKKKKIELERSRQKGVDWHMRNIQWQNSQFN